MKSLLLTDDIYMMVDKQVHKICHRFQRQYGGEYDELVGDARLYYTEAVHAWDPDKGQKFSTWVQSRIWWRLLSKVRKRLTKLYGRQQADDYDMETVPERSSFDMDRFCGELSEDAATAARAAIHVDAPVHGKLHAVMEYLFDLGWSATRIAESFREIVEAIS